MEGKREEGTERVCLLNLNSREKRRGEERVTGLISCSRCVIYKAGLAPWHVKLGDMGLCEKHISVEMWECVCFYSTCVEKVLSDEHSWSPSSERTLRESPENARINNTFFYLSSFSWKIFQTLRYFTFSLLFLSVCFPISCSYLSSPAPIFPLLLVAPSLSQNGINLCWGFGPWFYELLCITDNGAKSPHYTPQFLITLCVMWYYISIKYIVSICTLSELQEWSEWRDAVIH